MRTTLVIDDDILGYAKRLARQRHEPFRYVINEALRKGLSLFGSQSEKQPYSTIPHDMGLRKGCSLDNIQDLITRIEGEDSR